MTYTTDLDICEPCTDHDHHECTNPDDTRTPPTSWYEPPEPIVTTCCCHTLTNDPDDYDPPDPDPDDPW